MLANTMKQTMVFISAILSMVKMKAREVEDCAWVHLAQRSGLRLYFPRTRSRAFLIFYACPFPISPLPAIWVREGRTSFPHQELTSGYE